MATRRFVIKCTGCNAPVTNVRRRCPFCGAAVSMDGLGAGVASGKQGHVTMSAGAQVVVGAATSEHRDCPHCGAHVSTSDVNCSQCGEAVVLTSLWLRSLVIEKGASLTVEAGGKVMIGRPGPAPGLARAATQGDLAQVKECLRRHDDVDATDAEGKTPRARRRCCSRSRPGTSRSRDTSSRWAPRSTTPTTKAERHFTSPRRRASAISSRCCSKKARSPRS